jgi:hypothetical protein
MTLPRLPADPADHASHDPLLLAGLADRDPYALTPSERSRAEDLVATCPSCAAVHADLVALAVATPEAAIPSRPRDFRLAQADTARLRRAAWRRVLGSIATSRDALTRPLAIGLTTFGIVGILIGALPALFFAPSTPATLSAVGTAIQPPAVAPSAAASAPAAAPSAGSLAGGSAPASVEGGGVFSGGDEGQPASAAAPTGGEAAAPDSGPAVRDDAAGGSVLVVLGGALLIVGLGLFGLRWAARRFGD